MIDTEPVDSLSVILAAYQEANNLRILLPRLKTVLFDLTPQYEVLVVDTQSPKDDTELICTQNNVRYIRRQGGNNYGDAIRTGINEINSKFVIFMDADCSHNPEFIAQMWRKRNEADLVIASRYIPGGSTDNPWILVQFSRLLNSLFISIVKIPVMDVSNSFRLYRHDLLRNLTLVNDHFDILEEILAKLLWERNPPAKILEIPYSFEKRYSGKSKRNLFVFGFHFMQALFRLKTLRNKQMKTNERSSILKE